VTSISDECGQRLGQRTALSSTLISERHRVDDTGEGDVLCDLLSRDLNDVSSGMLRDAGGVASVQQIDDAEMENSSDTATVKLKSYACDVCHKSYSDNRAMTKHKRIHTGVRPYVCPTCTKAFIKPSDLFRHIQTHTGDRPHTCNICHKQFTQRHHRNKHVLTHAGERQHRCDICDERFAHRSNLVMHKRCCEKRLDDDDSILRHLLADEDEVKSPEPDGVPAAVAPISSRVMSSYAISDDELMSLSTHQLNDRLRSMSADERSRVKQRRRTLKNRSYAQTCRTRRLADQHQLKHNSEALAAELKALKKRVRSLTAELDYYRGHGVTEADVAEMRTFKESVRTLTAERDYYRGQCEKMKACFRQFVSLDDPVNVK